MRIPKIIFSRMTLEENIDIIKWAFYEDNGSMDVHKYVIEYFPELASVDMNNKDEVYKIIKEVVTRDYNHYIDRINSEVERYNKVWSNYNDKYFTMLTNYLGVESSTDIIDAKVGLTPIFPRYLDTWTFVLTTGISDQSIIEVCSHESLHFYWFNKWKELYPDTSRREYDSPYITWKYSEMVVDPILGNEPFKSLLNFNEKSTYNFYELYDDNKLVMDNLKDIYKNNDLIDNKIIKGFNYISDYYNRSNNKVK